MRRKTGSLQQFLDAEGGADDYGPGLFSALNVQRIAQLDLRFAALPGALHTGHTLVTLRCMPSCSLLNTDRNGENLLVVGDRTQSASQLRLVPIDHGYCLPDRLDLDFFTLHWRRWKQVKVRALGLLSSNPTRSLTRHPQEPCLPEVVEYILCLDVDADALRLRDALRVRDPCLMYAPLGPRVHPCADTSGPAR